MADCWAEKMVVPSGASMSGEISVKVAQKAADLMAVSWVEWMAV